MDLVKESIKKLSRFWKEPPYTTVCLGKQWKAEADTAKIEFRNQAEQLKRKHAEDHPDYHYSPRKPSEKKRRVSSRQNVQASRTVNSPLTVATSSTSTPPRQANPIMNNPTFMIEHANPLTENSTPMTNNVNIHVDAQTTSQGGYRVVVKNPVVQQQQQGTQQIQHIQQEQAIFDPDFFEHLVQQMNVEYEDDDYTAQASDIWRNFIVPGNSESFEFSDYVTDCF